MKLTEHDMACQLGSVIQANEPWSTLYKNGNIDRFDIGQGSILTLTDLLTVRSTFVEHRPDFSDTCTVDINDMHCLFSLDKTNHNIFHLARRCFLDSRSL